MAGKRRPYRSGNRPRGTACYARRQSVTWSLTLATRSGESMRKSLRAAAAGAACVVAGAALYGAGAATAGQSTANSTHEPYNIGLLTKDIDTYYGTTADSNGVYQASPTSPYAKDLARIDADAKKYIDRAARTSRAHHQKPAVMFDIDDTVLLSLDYEK